MTVFVAMALSACVIYVNSSGHNHWEHIHLDESHTIVIGGGSWFDDGRWYFFFDERSSFDLKTSFGTWNNESGQFISTLNLGDIVLSIKDASEVVVFELAKSLCFDGAYALTGGRDLEFSAPVTTGVGVKWEYCIFAPTANRNAYSLRWGFEKDNSSKASYVQYGGEAPIECNESQGICRNESSNPFFFARFRGESSHKVRMHFDKKLTDDINDNFSKECNIGEVAFYPRVARPLVTDFSGVHCFRSGSETATRRPTGTRPPSESPARSPSATRSRIPTGSPFATSSRIPTESPFATSSRIPTGSPFATSSRIPSQSPSPAGERFSLLTATCIVLGVVMIMALISVIILCFCGFCRKSQCHGALSDHVAAHPFSHPLNTDDIHRAIPNGYYMATQPHGTYVRQHHGLIY